MLSGGRAAKRQDTKVRSDSPSKVGMARVFGVHYTGSHRLPGQPCTTQGCKHGDKWYTSCPNVLTGRPF